MSTSKGAREVCWPSKMYSSPLIIRPDAKRLQTDINTPRRTLHLLPKWNFTLSYQSFLCRQPFASANFLRSSCPQDIRLELKLCYVRIRTHLPQIVRLTNYSWFLCVTLTLQITSPFNTTSLMSDESIEMSVAFAWISECYV